MGHAAVMKPRVTAREGWMTIPRKEVLRLLALLAINGAAAQKDASRGAT